jgi:hypothetical protein
LGRYCLVESCFVVVAADAENEVVDEVVPEV